MQKFTKEETEYLGKLYNIVDDMCDNESCSNCPLLGENGCEHLDFLNILGKLLEYAEVQHKEREMKAYTFDVKAHYRTDQIWAENEEEARAIANEELQYCGEEYDTIIELVSVEEEGES